MTNDKLKTLYPNRAQWTTPSRDLTSLKNERTASHGEAWGGNPGDGHQRPASLPPGKTRAADVLKAYFISKVSTEPLLTTSHLA